METLRNYIRIPRIHLPTFAQLKDGSFLSKHHQKEQEESILKDFESKLVYVQEVAVWSSPVASFIWLIITQLVVFYFTSWTSCTTTTCSCYILLSLYIYITWVYTVWPAVRVPPGPDDDDEKWTPVHPDVMSAPEMQTCITQIRCKTSQIYSGLVMLRQDQPGKFCIIMSLVFLITGGLGVTFSTPVILHSLIMAVLVLPALIVRVNKHETLGPWMVWMTSLLASMTDMLVYTGLHVEDGGLKPSNSYLDQLQPEMSPETESVLARPLSWRPEVKEKEADYSLAGNISIPSHEEVENDSLLNLMEFEQGLQPPQGHAAAESEDELENEVAEKMRDYNESDSEDSLEIEPEPATMIRTVASAAAGGLVSDSFSSMLSSIMTSNTSSTQRRSSGLEDFELISQDDLEEEQI